MYVYYFWLKVRLSLDSRYNGPHAIQLPLIEGRMPAEPASPLLFFAAADSRYFDNYGRSFIGSLISHQASPCVHIHLFNPRPEQLAYLQHLSDSDPRLRLSYTWENVDLRPLPPRRRGRYYYSVRFVRMAEIVQQAPADCLCLDIDTLLARPAEQLLAALSDCDIAFHSRFQRFGIDTKLLAGTLFVHNSRLPARLLVNISNRIKSFITRGQILNKLDQIVIYDEFNRFRKHEPGLRFKPLDEPVIDTGFTDDGIIWYPKGQSKNDKLYEEKRQHYASLV